MIDDATHGKASNIYSAYNFLFDLTTTRCMWIYVPWLWLHILPISIDVNTLHLNTFLILGILQKYNENKNIIIENCLMIKIVSVVLVLQQTVFILLLSKTWQLEAAVMLLRNICQTVALVQCSNNNSNYIRDSQL